MDITLKSYIITDGTTVVTVDNITADAMRRIATSNCLYCPFVNNCNLLYAGACATMSCKCGIIDANKQKG